ncbi:MAG: hypothetical protein LBH45_00925 [Campylobacteraceae bacterium]|jgi:uncharacterized membrane protein YidH (DUF202 family)|nr:hypothetical protein [Campylobacteraceae bacterium]
MDFNLPNLDFNDRYNPNIEDEKDKNCWKALKKILERLSQSAVKNENNEPDQELMWGYIKKLNYNVYKNSYRHYYSDIYALIRNINKQNDTSVSILLENIVLIYNNFDELISRETMPKEENWDTINLKRQIRKLYDHINLEFQRLNDYESFENAERRAEKVGEKLNTLTGNLNKTSSKLKNQTISFVTILGIFAAIVITFISGLIFSSTVFSNLDKVSIEKLSFLIILFGLVILVLGYFLFNFINKIIFDENKKELNDKKFIFITITLLIILISLFIYIVKTENINTMKNIIFIAT